MRSRLAAMLVAVLCGLAAPAAAQIKAIFSNDTNQLGVKGRSFEVFKSEIEKRLGSQVVVELHHSGTLFDQLTQVQGLQLGGADVIAPEPGTYAPLSPKLNALFLPFLLPNAKAVNDAMNDPVIRASFVPDLEKKNIEPIAVWLNGPRDISNRGPQPILLPQDLRGVKIRVQAIPVSIRTMQALGANVVAMDWTQVPTALQQGVIDAVEPTPNSLVGAGLSDLISQVSRVGYQYSFYLLGANRRWWTGLPNDVRQGIQQSLDVATQWNWANTERENAEAYDKVRAAGRKVYDLTPEQHDQWVQAVQPVWKEFGEALVGPEVMGRLRDIARKDR